MIYGSYSWFISCLIISDGPEFTRVTRRTTSLFVSYNRDGYCQFGSFQVILIIKYKQRIIKRIIVISNHVEIVVTVGASVW